MKTNYIINKFYHTIKMLEETSSTNDEIKKIANDYEEGYVLISDMQTKGKGRNGKSFFCEKGKGIYLSILLKPKLTIEQTFLITAAAAVAAAKTINKLYNVNCQIKWVNDIFIENKKIAGILCESSLKQNCKYLDYLIMGIGINVHQMNIPDQLNEIAASIEDFTKINHHRSDIIACFLNEFYNYYSNLNEKNFMNVYRNLSNILGKKICVHENNEIYEAKAVFIDDNAYLHVEKDNGQKHILCTGEISVKK